MIEVEVCYLNERKTYVNRKSVNLPTMPEAIDMYNNTIKKFKANKQNALIVIRTKTNGLWKTERTTLV